MGTMFKTSIYVVCCLSLISLSSCSDDDDDEDGVLSELVSTTIPNKGWSGSTTNGICTYRSNDISEDDEFSSYYAFAFENGKCTNAVFNVVCENEAAAKHLSQMLNSGEWANEDEEEYNYISLLKNRQNLVSIQAARNAKVITRSANVMGITCTQDGKIVYFKVEAVKGLDGETVKYVMETWDTGLDYDILPEKTIFGTWNEATGKYTSNSIFAIPDTKIELETAFNSSDILTKYIATFTLPNGEWAEMIEESLREQADVYRELVGINMEIVRNGNLVTSNIQDVEGVNNTKEYIVKMIVAMDILNARPIGTMIWD